MCSLIHLYVQGIVETKPRRCKVVISPTQFHFQLLNRHKHAVRAHIHDSKANAFPVKTCQYTVHFRKQ